MNSLKKSLAPVCANRKNFHILATKNNAPVPENLDPDILADLFEICVKFGEEDEEKGNIYLNIEKEEKIFFRIFIHSGQEFGLFMAVSTDGLDTTNDTFFQAVLKYGMTLFWQPTNTREIVQQAIAEADAIAKERGYLIKGKRRMINYTESNSA